MARANANEITEQSTCQLPEESRPADLGAGGSVPHNSLQHTDQHADPSPVQQTATNGTGGEAASTVCSEKSEQTERKPADSNMTDSKLEAGIELGDFTKSTTDEPKTRERKRKSGWDTNTGGHL